MAKTVSKVRKVIRLHAQSLYQRMQIKGLPGYAHKAPHIKNRLLAVHEILLITGKRYVHPKLKLRFRKAHKHTFPQQRNRAHRHNYAHRGIRKSKTF